MFARYIRINDTDVATPRHTTDDYADATARALIVCLRYYIIYALMSAHR